MKRIFPILLIFGALAGFGSAAEAAKLRVVSSLQDFSSIAQSIGGDRVETFALAKGYQDPHFVDAKPSFVLQLSRADLLIVVGLELEIGWLPPLIDQSRNNKIQPGDPGYLDASAGTDILRAPDGAGHPRDGRRPSVRQPALLARPRKRPGGGARDRRPPVAARSGRQRGLPAERSPTSRRRLTPERARSGGQDGALQGHPDRHLPPLLAELRRALRAQYRRATSSPSRASRRRPRTRWRSST